MPVNTLGDSQSSQASRGTDSFESVRGTRPVAAGIVEPLVLLILVGLPGSGKSSFAESLVRHSHDPSWPGERQWIRASQDDAPHRRRQECEAIVRNGLRLGCHVVVDRVGFDQAQRAHFIAIGNATNPRPRIYCLILPVSLPTLQARLQLRPTHPSLPDPETALRVLGQMTRQFHYPTPENAEGFDLILALPEIDQPAKGEWAMQDVRRVMGRIESFGEEEVRPLQSSPSFNACDFQRRGSGIKGHYGNSYQHQSHLGSAARPYQ